MGKKATQNDIFVETGGGGWLILPATDTGCLRKHRVGNAIWWVERFYLKLAL